MSEALTDWVGRTRITEDLIAPFQARGMAAALDYDTAPGQGDALPPGWHWMYFPDIAPQSALGADGHEARGEFLPPVPLPRRMWAGNRLVFHRPLVIGKMARRESEIISVEEKTGRAGALAFVTVRHRYVSGGDVALEEWHDIVYRAPAEPGAPPPPIQAPPTEKQWQRALVPDEVMLFRYSAVTFNGHRIHYDHPYVTGTEGYEGLIVHGPLTASLLLDLVAREAPERRLSGVQFRAMRPVYAGRTLTVEGAADGNGGGSAWAVDADGAMAMRADLTFA